jgi:DNA-binding NtrC family response regulator
MAQKKGKILIVDDNKELLTGLKLFLSPHFSEIQTEKNPNLLPSIIQKQKFDLYLLDMNFKAGVNTGNEGIFWMRKILEIDADAVIVFITAYGDVELAVKAIKEGATDFIQKSWDEDKILSTIHAAYKIRESKKEISLLKNKQQHLNESITKSLPNFIGESEEIKKVIETVKKVAATDANVLILGENGTGKELIAREIHQYSLRKNDVFISVDLGSLTETLFESELFGYMKGAFTDAKTDKPGRFEIASGGSIFLDEIGNIPLHLQSKLLSVLQNKEVIPIGSNSPIAVDARLICATNKDLYQSIDENKFREDLLYRINTVQIEIPPLRKRISDIEPLSNYFLSVYSDKYNRKNLTFNKEVLTILENHNWPGNVRELQHCIEKAVILSDSKKIKSEDIDFSRSKKTVERRSKTINLEENEKLIISEAIETYKGNMTLVAKNLGINRSTLYAKIKKYEL